jgi:Flp pilus assembly protein TadD
VAGFHKALELDPNHVEAHNHLGVLLHRSGSLSGAVEEYTAAILLQPENGQLHQNLAAALQQQGKVAEARAAYQRACQLGWQEPCKRLQPAR